MLSMLVTLETLRLTLVDRLRAGDRDRGATAVEYGLIVALIAAVVVGVVGFLGRDVLNGFQEVESNIGGRQSPAAP